MLELMHNHFEEVLVYTFKRKSSLLVSLFFGAAVLMSNINVTQAVSPTWSTPVGLSGNVSGTVFGSGNDQTLASSADGMSRARVWVGSAGVEVAVSSDGGQTWAAPIVTVTAASGGAPQIVGSDDGLTYTVVWRSGGTGTYALESITSVDGGVTWSAPVVIGVIDVSSFRLAGSSDGSRVSVTMQHRVNNRQRTRTITSQDAGFTWGTAVNHAVPAFASTDRIPTVVMSDDGLVIGAAWYNTAGDGNRIRYAYSHDGGATWGASSSIIITTDTISNPGAVLTVSADGSNQAVGWTQYGASSSDRTNMASVSSDSGLTWSTPIAVSDSGEAPNDMQLISSDDGSSITAAWLQNGTYPSASIQTATSVDSGATWSAPTVIESVNSPSINYVRLAGSDDGSKMTIVWGTTGRYSTTNDSGATWSVADYIVPNNNGITKYYDIVSTASGSEFIATWRQYVGSGLYRVDVASLQSPDSVAPDVIGVPDRAANGSSWYNASVTIDWQATDPAPSSGQPTDPADTIAAQEGTHTYVSDQSCDLAGNCATGSLELSIDTVQPTITFGGNDGVYGASDTIAITCVATDATSDIASSNCPEVSGPAYNYIGTNTLNAFAVDAADNATMTADSFIVEVEGADVDVLIDQFVTSTNLANTLHSKVASILKAKNANSCNGKLNGFIGLVNAQTPAGISAADAAILIVVASELCE